MNEQASRPELIWPNKSRFLAAPRGADGKPVWLNPHDPEATALPYATFTEQYGDVNDRDPYTDNLLITGDSREALRLLTYTPEVAAVYSGWVKVVYLDPPFNTGQAFADYDDAMDRSAWLSFMRERLILARDLLTPDGSIWVHLDDAESHRTRCLLDEVFGPENFLATITWERTNKPKNNATRFSVIHDHILVYGKDATRTQVNGVPRKMKSASAYNKTDEAGRKYLNLTLRKTGNAALRTDSPGGWYPIPIPGGGEVWPIFPDGREGTWRWRPAKYAQQASELDWITRKDGVVEPATRAYLDEDTPRAIDTIWTHEQVGSTTTAAYELKALFPASARFSTPKPERLLERILHIASDPGDIVLDAFAGSGTTAAVAHKMHRRWVTAEILPDTVSNYVKPRLEAVISGTDKGGISKSVGWPGGGGFRSLTVSRTP